MSHTYDARTSAMPRSLALSSLSYLTIVVLLLLVHALLPTGPPSLVVVDVPPDFGKVFTPYVPEAPGGAVHPVVPPAQPGRIVPVDPDQTVQPTLLAPDSMPLVAYTGNQVGDHPAPPSGGAGGTSTATDDPRLGEFVYTDTMPELVHLVTPEYPPLAQQAGLEGTVQMRLLVGRDGRVHKVHIEHPGSLFDEAATTAGLQFVFTPATASGHPVSVWVAQYIRFTLR